MNTEHYPTAFPFTPTDRSGQIGTSEPGMTLLDAFAIAALPGVVQTCASDVSGQSEVSRETYFAERAYGIAAAMMNERLKYISL